MNLEFQEITIRNFLSFGNIPQTLSLMISHIKLLLG